MSGYSEACCKIPPIVAGQYEPRGEYKDFNGIKTYTTGPESATTGIIVFYDIFGFFPQTVQGADILAHSNTDRPSRVFMPDFLRGNPAKLEWYVGGPGEDEAKNKNLFGAWMKQNLSTDKHLRLFEEVLTTLSEQYGEIKSWGVMGYCYGGKVVSLIAGRETKPKLGAAVQSSPSMVDPLDAANVKIPMLTLTSQDEPVDTMKDFKRALTVTSRVEIFEDQVHGWMGARADLEGERTRAEYERGYTLAVEFFQRHL